MPLSLSEPTYSKFNSRVAFDGTTLYVLHDGKVSTYAPEGDGFRYESDLELDFVPDEIFTDRSGILYLCANGRDVIARAQGMEYVAASRLKHVAVHPSGAMAISWGTTGDVTVVGLESGEQREMTFPGFKSVNHLFVTQNFVVINGPLEETGSMGLRIFDMQGNLVRQLTKEETTTGFFGSVSAVTETANGLVIVDSNLRDIYFADKQGNVLQSVDMPVLLGTGYPWPSSVITTQDGRVLLCLTDERQDDSCTETLIFEIKGF